MNFAEQIASDILRLYHVRPEIEMHRLARYTRTPALLMISYLTHRMIVDRSRPLAEDEDINNNAKEGDASRNSDEDGEEPNENGEPPDAGGDQSAEGGDQLAEGGDHFAEGGDKLAKGGDQPAKGGDQPAEGGDHPAEGGDQSAEGGDQSAEEDEQIIFIGRYRYHYGSSDDSDCEKQ